MIFICSQIHDTASIITIENYNVMVTVLFSDKLRNRVSDRNLYVTLNANGRDDFSCRSSNEDPGAIKPPPDSQASSKAVSR